MFTRDKKGYALLLVLILIPILILLMVMVIQSVTYESGFTLKELNAKRAYYLAETALNTAYFEFSGQTFSHTTHLANGVTQNTSSSKLLITVPNVAKNNTDGWYEWKWQQGSAFASFMGESYATETFRYEIYNPTSTTWVIQGTGIYGTTTKRLQLQGYTQSPFTYALFSNGDLGEFVRGEDQTVTGEIQVNGDLYFRPSGTTLQIFSDQVNASGMMIRFQDPWGRPDTGGTVQITDSTGVLRTMNGSDQGASGQGNAFDSFNPNWLDPNNGALKKWGGVVEDVTLGAKHVDAPTFPSFDPGGFYDTSAGKKITPTTPNGSGVTQKTFYNNAEEHTETVKEIDLSVYSIPSNGLIYATTPIRLINGQKLSGNLTIVSNSNIYTIGDFNKVYGDRTSFRNGTSTEVSAALMTSGRIYHLSHDWNDSNAQNTNSPTPTGNDPTLYTGDDNDVIEINAALVDGPPTVDERKYAQTWQGVTNPYYNENSNVYANSDDFLEDLSSQTVRKRGSIMHMQNATMASFNNSNYGPGVNDWVINSSYNPPTRDYSHDSRFDSLTGQPPFVPYVSVKLYWKELF